MENSFAAACGIQNDFSDGFGPLASAIANGFTVPEGVEVSDDYHFICAYGQQGDYTWAIRIGGWGENTGVVALMAPTSHFEGAATSITGGNVCDYIAYTDLFTG